MPITHRPYNNSETDLSAVKAMLNQVSRHPELDNNWDAGRMDFWRSSAHGDKPQSWFEQNTHIWLTADGQVTGFFVSEYGKGDIFFVAHPEHLDLIPDILEWGLTVWAKGRKQVYCSVRPHDRSKVAALTQVGFIQGAKENNVRTYDLRTYDFNYTLKPGFTMTHLTAYGDIENRIALVQNAFTNPGYNEARLRAVQANKTYQPDLDLVIVSPEGQAVGYCIGWVLEDDPSEGFIEPMGVHSDFRRHGFATALAKECFKRLNDRGVHFVTIASGPEPRVANYLYDSLGPISMVSAYKYELTLK